MEIIFLLLVGLYVIMVVFFSILWKIKPAFLPSPIAPRNRISVLIAARNEEENIGGLIGDLVDQNYPANLYEIIVLDDHSEDQTASIVKSFEAAGGPSVRLVTLKDEYGKKAAVRTGVGEAVGDLIITTDADCRVGKNYLRTVEAFYREKSLRMVTGPVTFSCENKLFERMQTIEFASLIGTGAVTLSVGVPSMCNGASLAYSKDVFREVNGFAGNESVASGDDEFLMHKVAARYPGKVQFLKSPEAVVRTDPHKTLSGFFQQRRRWASKWNHYQSVKLQFLAAFVFLQNLAWPVMFVWCIFNPSSFFVFLSALGLKVLAEFVFLRQMVHFLGGRFDAAAFGLLQFIYPVYVSFFALISKSGKYLWKGRRLN